jgi:hypothetical protein
MDPSSDMSGFFPCTVLSRTAADREREAPIRHRVRLDDPRCTCGAPREECVRQRMRAMWGT